MSVQHVIVENAVPSVPEKRPGLRTFNVFVDGNCYRVEVEEVHQPCPRECAKPRLLPSVVSRPIPKPPGPAANPPEPSNGKASAKGTQLTAPMPGVVVRHEKAVGDEVQAGDVVLVLEAMKMQNSIVAPANGKLVSTHCEQGQMVRKGALLAVIA